MAERKDKPSFNWESGAILDEKSYDALGGVKAKGAAKLPRALAADPERRRKEREEFVLKEQVKPYTKKTPDKDEPFVIEESVSGLSTEIENTKARKLLDTNKPRINADRFGKK